MPQQWQTEGVYRVLDVDGVSINWDSEDPEFKKIFEEANKPKSKRESEVGGHETQVPDVSPPKALIAIFDCGISKKAYLASRVTKTHVVPSAAKGLLAEPALRERRSKIKTREQELSELQSSREPLTQQLKDVGVEKRAQIAELKKKLKDTPNLTAASQSFNVMSAEIVPSKFEALKVALKDNEVCLGICKAIEVAEARQKELKSLQAEVTKKIEQKNESLKQLTDEIPGTEETAGQKSWEIAQKGLSGNHGTFCAAKAGWGSSLIELADIRMQVGHGAGNQDPAEWREGVLKAVEFHCDIVSCSVTLPFNGIKPPATVPIEGKSINDLIRDNPQILFICTGGNDLGYFDPASRGGAKFAPAEKNVLVVGGCTRDGKLNHLSPYGAVDIYAPNSYVPQHAPDDDLDGGGSPNTFTNSTTHDGVPVAPVDAVTNNPPQSKPDLGVSFGVPMVANVAAKCKLINKELSAADLAFIVKSTARETQRVKPSGGDREYSVMMMDPVAAYEKAASWGVEKD